jgi:hypothetical protein
MKMMLLPFLIQRDGGLQCYYCKIKLRLNEIIFEHLNNNRLDNREENLVISCQSCNVKKKHHADMQITAKEKLIINENGNYLSERITVYSSESNTASTEIIINLTNFEITEKYLTEIIQTDGNVLYTDALNSCVYLCKKKTRHGSQQSIRNYISTLTCGVGPFMISKDENNKKIIVKRSDT